MQSKTRMDLVNYSKAQAHLVARIVSEVVLYAMGDPEGANAESPSQTRPKRAEPRTVSEMSTLTHAFLDKMPPMI